MLRPRFAMRIVVALGLFVALALGVGAMPSGRVAAAPITAPPNSVFAWGSDGNGQLGNGSAATADQPIPVRACVAPDCEQPILRITMIASGLNHTLALKEDGSVWAWGSDSMGQLGNGSATAADQPAAARVCANAACTSYLSHIVAIAAGGNFSLALTDTGAVLAWGTDNHGQLGDGATIADQSAPVAVCADVACTGPLTGIADIAAGGSHALALKADGTLLSWGWNDAGQLGNGSSGTDQPTPGQVCADAGCTAPLGGISRVGAGNAHSLAVKNDFTLLAWGNDGGQQLGNGAADPDRHTPVMVCADATCTTPFGDVKAVVGGRAHTVALKRDGSVWAWGWDNFGEVGNGGTKTKEPLPVAVCADTTCTGPLTGASAIAAGSNNSFAVLDDGTVRAWGSDYYSQLGNGGTDADQVAPVQVCADAACTAPLTNAIAIAAGVAHAVAIVDATAPTAMTLNSDFVLYGGYALIRASVMSPGGAVTAGTVTFSIAGIQGSQIEEVDVNGRARAAFQFITLAPGTYTVTAHYSGTEMFDPSDSSTTLHVRMARTNINLGPITPAGCDTSEVTTLVDLGTTSSINFRGSITVEIMHGNTVVASSSEHSPRPGRNDIPIDISTLADGTYSVVAAYSGNEFYQESTASPSTLIIGPTQANVAVSAINTTYGQANTTLSAIVTSTNLTDLAGGTVTFVVKRGDQTVATLTSGPLTGHSATASVTLPLGLDFSAGDYTVTATYNGDYCALTNSGSNALTVAQAKTTTTLGTIPTPGCGATSVMIPVIVANTANIARLAGGTATVQLKQGDTVAASGSAAVSGTSPVTVQITVPLAGLANGTYTVAASFDGGTNFADSAATPGSIDVGPPATTIVVSAAPATYGDASVVLTATVSSASGSPLTGGTVTFIVRQGNQTRATLTSGQVTGSSPVTVRVTLMLNSGYNAGNYTVIARYSGNTCAQAGEGSGTLQLQRKVLWLKAQDRTVGLRQPNPPTTPPANCLAQATATTACWLQLANGSTFAYGQSWSALNFTALRFNYNRNPPATNAGEYPGKTYTITFIGVTSTNYDIRYQQGTLTVQ